ASQLDLTVPEMTALLGGLRVMDINTNNSSLGVFTDTPGVLDNKFFVNLLDMSTRWSKADKEDTYNGFDRKTGALKWKASSVDLIFSSNPELRAVAEVYASDDARNKFIHDFVKSWNKVMNSDRFDLNNK
ncbi:catalase-peroxidase, partial [Escherichia coli]|nr:catalase-peroxidase [Escherichia coli]EKY2166936.1 catalase-peroxidase [Escherichia coli]